MEERRGVTLVRTLVLLAILSVALLGMRAAAKKAEAEAVAVLATNIRRAAVQCYALEGFYPDSADYLEENYGLTYNKNRYVVRYIPVASNIAPGVGVDTK